MSHEQYTHRATLITVKEYFTKYKRSSFMCAFLISGRQWNTVVQRHKQTVATETILVSGLNSLLVLVASGELLMIIKRCNNTTGVLKVLTWGILLTAITVRSPQSNTDAVCLQFPNGVLMSEPESTCWSARWMVGFLKSFRQPVFSLQPSERWRSEGDLQVSVSNCFN